MPSIGGDEFAHPSETASTSPMRVGRGATPMPEREGIAGADYVVTERPSTDTHPVGVQTATTQDVVYPTASEIQVVPVSQFLSISKFQQNA